MHCGLASRPLLTRCQDLLDPIFIVANFPLFLTASNKQFNGKLYDLTSRWIFLIFSNLYDVQLTIHRKRSIFRCLRSKYISSWCAEHRLRAKCINIPSMPCVDKTFTKTKFRSVFNKNILFQLSSSIFPPIHSILSSLAFLISILWQRL